MPRKVQYRGRYLVIGWTIVFVAVAGLVVRRQGRAFGVQGELRELRIERDQLREARSDLESRISALRSQRVLSPKAAALGLRTPSDSETVNLRIDRGP